MEERQIRPDIDRIGILTAAVLLALVMARLLGGAPVPFFPGLSLPPVLNLSVLLTLLAAGLTAAGMEWVLRAHPDFEPRHSFEHWILPTLTTLVAGLLLRLLPAGSAWLGGLLLVGALLILTFRAEYVTVSAADARYPLATAGLIALSFALFTILAAALRYAGARLLFALPALFVAATLVALRTLQLRLERWEWSWSLGFALVVTQFAAALMYWPLGPLRYGLILLAPLYALVSLRLGLGEGRPLRRALAEPLVLLTTLLILAMLIG